MLVLSRRVGEEIVIDEGIRVVVAGVRGNKVRLGIYAPESIRVDRQEVHKRRLLPEYPQGLGVEKLYSCDEMEVTEKRHDS